MNKFIEFLLSDDEIVPTDIVKFKIVLTLIVLYSIVIILMYFSLRVTLQSLESDPKPVQWWKNPPPSNLQLPKPPDPSSSNSTLNPHLNNHSFSN